MDDFVLPGTGVRMAFQRPARAVKVTAPKPTRAEKRRATRPTPLKKFSCPSTLKGMLSMVTNGEAELMRVLAGLDPDTADERVKILLDEWETWTPKRRRQDGPDGLCAVCDVPPAEVFGWWAKAAFQHSVDVMQSMVAVAAPEIMRASIAKAMDVYEGTDERRILFSTNGFLPTNRGIAIQNNVSTAPTTASDPALPSYEHQQRAVTSIVRRALPSAVVVDADPSPDSPACITPTSSPSD